AGFGGASIQQYGAENEFLIRLPVEEAKVGEGATAGSDALLLAEIGKVAPAEIRRVEFVGPQVGQELRVKGFTAMGVAIIAILIYVWLRFEMRYGLGAILALVHDVVLTMGVMSLLGTEMTLTVLAALLTLIGYSLNDTIVIFDRIRENRARYPNRPLDEVLNLSVNQTVARTIMTVSTVMLVLFALLIWGGEVIYDFALVLTIGTVLGTYSSVFVASPVLLALEDYYQRMKKEGATQ
ncbi:MAG: protein translocase subunit SecF, partial [Proteobacteria bacterium]|nr:protein translocase subunit SecF [Pseudomonadota bacterium]